MKRRKGSRRHHHAVTTVTQSRCAVFAPTLRPTADVATIVVETAWAKATISRVQLTQRHRDILDVLFTRFDPHYRTDGSCAFVFHPHAVLRALGHKRGTNIEWLRDKFRDLEAAGLKVETPKYVVETSIVRKHAWTKDDSMYGVVLESEYMKFFERETRVHSEALTDAILSLKNATTRALVRFVISHRSWTKTLDDTLDAMAYVGGERNRRLAKNRILAEREALLRDFGIGISKAGRFQYDQHNRVWFENPPALADGEPDRSQ
jgi:hypothetical protein